MKTMLSIFIFLLSISLLDCIVVPVEVDLLEPKAVVDSKFLSVTIDSSIVKDKFKNINLKSERLIALARALTHPDARPEIYLRVGGTAADHTIFDPSNDAHQEQYVLDGDELDLLCTFAEDLGWELIYGLNVLLRDDAGFWDPHNAIKMIDYLNRKKFRIHYELGNEPDLFPVFLNITIPPKILASDFRHLREILDDKKDGKSLLIGPDIGPFLAKDNYFESILSNMSKHVLSAVSFHHYYSSSNVTVFNFTSTTYLDQFLSHGLEALSIIRNALTEFEAPPVWLGETSSTWGHGSVGLGESFSAGFVWLDKLGLAAQMNISVVIRQSLVGGYYSLMDEKYEPAPDYWSSLLYKQLMGRVVLGVTGYLQYDRKVRVYAHCFNRYGGRTYNPTSLVLMFLNLHSVKMAYIKFIMDGWEDLKGDLYMFQPAYGNLADRHVRLNGEILKMSNETLPALNPVVITQPYIIAPLSYGFIVVPHSNVPACK